MTIITHDIFTQDLLASIIEEKTIQLKEGERRTVSILFADLKGFTAMSEMLFLYLFPLVHLGRMGIMNRLMEN